MFFYLLMNKSSDSYSLSWDFMAWAYLTKPISLVKKANKNSVVLGLVM